MDCWSSHLEGQGMGNLVVCATVPRVKTCNVLFCHDHCGQISNGHVVLGEPSELEFTWVWIVGQVTWKVM